MIIDDHTAEILRAIAAGNPIQLSIRKGHATHVSVEGALRHILGGDGANLQIAYPPVKLYIPVHQGTPSTVVLAGAVDNCAHAMHEQYNQRPAGHEQMGVLILEIDPGTLQVISTTMERVK